jgi:hypothetical protein
VAILVGIQKVKNGLVSIIAAMIFKCLDENGGSIFFAQALDELDLCVDTVIVVNESADKTNDDDGWSRSHSCRGSRRL